MIFVLKCFSGFLTIAGIIYASRDTTFVNAWLAGLYGAALGTVLGRFFLFGLCAIIVWKYASRLSSQEKEHKRQKAEELEKKKSIILEEYYSKDYKE